MKKRLSMLYLMAICIFFSKENANAITATTFVDDYTAQVTFPAGYQIGDYVEFVKVQPRDAGSSGNYEISISYTRNGVAAAATYLASISHWNPSIWRELGRTNSNGHIGSGSDGHNYTIDCNTEYGNPRFRIRAIKTLGITTVPLTVNIKIRSINSNGTWTALNVTGSDLTVTKLHPMTNDWSLYVGNPYSSNSAEIAIKALQNGNVGIGTATPTEKLSVKGKIRAQEVKVEMSNWPDYVFSKDYALTTLAETEQHIKEQGHLPGIPAAAEVEKNGVELGEMNKKLLQKIEELTLYLIEMKNDINHYKKQMTLQEDRVRNQNENINKISGKLRELQDNQTKK